MQPELNEQALNQISELFPTLSVLVLLGSRATGKTHANSDWDFAFYLSEPDDFSRLALTEQLRAQLAAVIGCNIETVDLIDLRAANLAMRSVIANEGIALITVDNRFWFKFLERTWRELEYWQWEQTHDA
ncbi:hypothetical protein VT06_13105 [Arsukibacterium sp. MJ3]|uniref:type VII toxin-antitoxin system MntA family adenylyltransferase antitoxin n=1 Tax=Arsukibacterium sp. MJ3 TaxID=1632859 RepID=UPI0006271522|nr:nucleotidyltransferase domain-containing protein [Arsukibacterium sp. MJ3]KKO48175.1 hypothetical protein VT06_13105 [Arsukibacterium sp. MJ3]